jgi:hypothetical protein
MSDKGAIRKPWAVRPYEGLGPLSFGMSRKDVMDVLGEPHDPPCKGGSLITGLSDYFDVGVTLDYSMLEHNKGDLVLMTAWREVDPMLDHIHLIGKAKKVVASLRRAGFEGKRLRAGYKFGELGFELVTTGENLDKVNAVTLWNRAYERDIQSAEAEMTSDEIVKKMHG